MSRFNPLDYLFLSSFVRRLRRKILGENNYERRRQPAEKHGGTIKKQEIHRGRFEKEMKIPKTDSQKETGRKKEECTNLFRQTVDIFYNVYKY